MSQPVFDLGESTNIYKCKPNKYKGIKAVLIGSFVWHCIQGSGLNGV